jgi:hypothetical protein
VIDAVDDEDFDGIFGGDQLDAELLLERAEERGSIGGVGGARVAYRSLG